MHTNLGCPVTFDGAGHCLAVHGPTVSDHEEEVLDRLIRGSCTEWMTIEDTERTGGAEVAMEDQRESLEKTDSA